LKVFLEASFGALEPEDDEAGGISTTSCSSRVFLLTKTSSDPFEGQILATDVTLNDNIFNLKLINGCD
jgi:hypothetical protein